MPLSSRSRASALNKSGKLSKLFTFRSIGTYYSKGAKQLNDKERYLKQRQTYASRAQRNRSLYAIYQKKVELEERKAHELDLKIYDLWDVRKHIAFKRKKMYTVLSDDTKAILNEYEVLPKYIQRLWSTFNKLDKKNIGYITVD